MGERVLVDCDDDLLRTVARIIGDSSAAAKALSERDRRIALGEDAVILQDVGSGMLLVGPRPPSRHEGEERG